jgi:hypothetical protein
MAERCGSCGREGTLEYVEEVPIVDRPIRIHTGEHVWEEATERTILNIQRCSVCEAPTINKYYWCDEFDDPAEPRGFERLHPPLHQLEDLPERVRTRYESMLELLHAPDAFAVRAGRLLEAVCTDQGVARGALGPRLDQLAGKKRQVIPKALAEQAHLVREFRNLGGHDDAVEVDEGDVRLITGFVEALLEFLYWGPAKLARGQKALQNRVTAAKGP